MKKLLTKAAVLVSMLTAVSGTAGNLFQNSGFEEISSKNNFPMFWARILDKISRISYNAFSMLFKKEDESELWTPETVAPTLNEITI